MRYCAFGKDLNGCRSSNQISLQYRASDLKVLAAGGEEWEDLHGRLRVRENWECDMIWENAQEEVCC